MTKLTSPVLGFTATLLSLGALAGLVTGCSSDSTGNDTNGNGAGASASGGNGSGGSGNGSGSTASGSTASGSTASGGNSTGTGSSSSGGTADWGKADVNQGQGGPGTGYAACATPGKASAVGKAWDTEEGVGPDSHDAIYGAAPRLVAAPRGDGSFDVVWQESKPATAFHVTHVEKNTSGYASKWTVSAPSLGRIGGLGISENGEPVVATAILEAISGTQAPEKQHRDGILQLVKLGGDCKESYRQELRADFDGNASNLPVYQPYQAGSSRLTIGKGTFLLHYTQMTEFDTGLKTRHQIGRMFEGTVADGKLSSELGSISHSFDQRSTFDGTDFITLAMGDASHRGIELSRVTIAGKKTNRDLYSIKGGGSNTGGGYNNVFTRLGGAASSKNGYVHLFASEAGNEIAERVNVSRNLAWVHTPVGFAQLAQPEKYVVTVADTKSKNATAQDWDVSITDYWNNSFAAKNTGVVWLTDYADRLTAHVERPKLVRWGEDRFYVVWEKWTLTDYVETWSMVVNEFGGVVVPAKAVGAARLSRADDAFLLDGKAAWLESHGGVMSLHTVDPELKHLSFVL